jgi:hypothetical protein
MGCYTLKVFNASNYSREYADTFIKKTQIPVQKAGRDRYLLPLNITVNQD